MIASTRGTAPTIPGRVLFCYCSVLCAAWVLTGTAGRGDERSGYLSDVVARGHICRPPFVAVWGGVGAVEKMRGLLS